MILQSKHWQHWSPAPFLHYHSHIKRKINLSICLVHVECVFFTRHCVVNLHIVGMSELLEAFLNIRINSA